ncbi:MAG TPA: hypothetical protein PLF01_07975, partial [Alphaproteobacteria bacterium]|nr:hypothetical protein [Alphaproteobacteria bacterium]
LLVAGMRERMRNGSGGVTVLALDNLEGNGSITNALVKEMAREVDPALANWIDTNISFPNTAVDRITPKATTDFADAAGKKFGDAFPVIGTEVPRELAIGDNHIKKLPALEKVGVIITHDPKAFFERKFRLLNRGHTVVATLAQRIGQTDGQPIDTIDKAIEVPEVKTFFKTLLASEVKQALPEATKDNVDTYIDEVIARFGNIILQDQVTRVGGEGQRKIPKYIFSGIEQAIEHNLPYEGLVLTAATWVFSASGGLNEHGRPINMNDPNLEKVRSAAVDIKAAATAADNYQSAVEGVKIVLNRHDFWKPFAANEDFARAMAYYMRQIDNNDLRSVLADYNKAREVGAQPVPHVS